MRLYSDLVSGDEMFSDAFPITLVDDFLYEVDCSMIVVKEGEVDIGANPSAEEAEEALESGATSVNNVVHSMRLAPTSFDKDSYRTYLKGYLKTIVAKVAPDRQKEFQAKAQAFAKKVMANIKDYDFYTGKDMDPEAMVVLLNFREDGVTPYLIFWKDGLKDEKY